MSRACSISTGQPFTLSRVCRVWGKARSSVYHEISRLSQSGQSDKQRPGPQGNYSDTELVGHIRAVIEESPFYAEGYRKVWARLRFQDIRTSPKRVLRLMRENGLLVHQRTSMHPVVRDRVDLDTNLGRWHKVNLSAHGLGVYLTFFAWPDMSRKGKDHGDHFQSHNQEQENP